MALFLVLAIAACGAQGALAKGPTLEPPPLAKAYSTRPQPDGVIGGDVAREHERILLQHIAARGDQAEPDGALAATAIWSLREVYAGRLIDGAVVAAVAHRFGFAGGAHAYNVQNVNLPQRDQVLRELVVLLPRDYRITRYGIAVGGGRIATVVGGIEASLEDFPRSVMPGSAIRLRGAMSHRFVASSVLVTADDGTVREFHMRSRHIEAPIHFATPGTYLLEIVGYRPNDFLRVLRVPVMVGVPERALPQAVVEDPTLTVEQAEARLLAMLNESRRVAMRPPLAPHAELRSSAVARSTELAATRSLGASSAEEALHRRLVDLRITVVQMVAARALTPESGYATIHESSERATLLDPLFTHVGVGVAFEQLPDGTRAMRATVILARQPPPEEALQDVASITAALQKLRTTQGLPAFRSDPLLASAAAAGLRAKPDSSPPSWQRAVNEAHAIVNADTQRTGRARVVCARYAQILEPLQLSRVPLVTDRRVEAVGVATQVFEEVTGPKLGVMMVFEAAPGAAISCP